MNRMTTDADETPERLAKNAAELAAWNQFYETCSFFRCDKDHCILLCKTVFGHFKRFVEGAFPKMAKRFDDSGYMVDFAYFLEKEMEKHELKPENAATALSGECGRKRYKDFVWTRVRNQPESPLKAIRGLMLTGQNSVLRDAVRKFLRKEFSDFDIRSGVPKAKVVDPVVVGPDGDEKLSFFDQIAEAATPDGRPYSDNRWIEEPEFTQKEKSEFRRVILETFSTKELAVWLAAFVKMITHPTLCRACGVGKSRLDVIWKTEIVGKKVRRLLESNLPVDFDTPEALRMLGAIAEEELSRNPKFKDFLEAYRTKFEAGVET